MRILSEFLVLNNILISVFFAQGTAFKSLPIASELSTKFCSFFPADPVLTGVDAQGPDYDALPRIIFNETDNTLIISHSRADLHYNVKDALLLKNVSKIICNLTEVLNKNKVEIVRIGVVAFYKVDDDKKQDYFSYVIDRYFAQGKDPTVKEVSCGWRKDIAIDKIPMNRWVRINATQEIGNGLNQVVIDSNTMSRNSMGIDGSSIDVIVNQCLEEYGGDLDAILDW